MRSRATLLAVLAPTVVGAALRFPPLDRQSFWLDEQPGVLVQSA